MKRVETKKLIKITAVAFALYLCIFYWPGTSGFLGVTLTVLAPLALVCQTFLLLSESLAMAITESYAKVVIQHGKVEKNIL